MGALTVCDWVAMGACALFALVGLFRGLSGELGGICGVVAAASLATFGRSFLLSLAKTCGLGESRWVALAVVVAACVLVWLLVRAIARRLISAVIPQPANALLGLVFGVVKALALIVLLLLLVRMLPGVSSEEILKFNCGAFQQVEKWACGCRTTAP